MVSFSNRPGSLTSIDSIGTDRTWVSAVRPDWTGAEALFGYENLLLPASSDGRAAWTVPAELQFMLRAADAPGVLSLEG